VKGGSSMSDPEYEDIMLSDENVEIEYRRNIYVKCPKCGEEYEEYDIDFEKVYYIECENCEHKYSFSYCPY
jgi:translation initiation factor 2 beta subunit (eIF-2beta)/eIF-5